VQAALDFGDPVGEYGALREGCGLVDVSWHDQGIVAGTDRQRFLNAYVTCDVKGLASGQGARGFFTSAQGRILADVVVAELGERLWLLLPPGREPALREHLGRFVLADRVELRSAARTAALALVGPRAAAALAGAGAPAPAGEWEVASWPAAGAEASVQRLRPCGEACFLIRVEREAAAAAAERLLAAGARTVGSSALERLRVEAGVPRFGADYDERHFPAETGLEDAVSFTKGCYLGQEVVARIHYRGHVNRRLAGLRFDPEAWAAGPVGPGEPLLASGEEVGTLGSVVASPRLDGPIALAVLALKASAPGTEVTTASGLTATVTALPFVG
jgi:folate-binding protein YgfZ